MVYWSMDEAEERTRQVPVWLRMNCIASATAYQLGLEHLYLESTTLVTSLKVNISS